MEIITLAFGNYSTLAAAQWANGTSLFDAEQPVLYMERRRSNVRVPRLLFLDHQQPSRVNAELLLNEGQSALDSVSEISTHVDPAEGSYVVRRLPPVLRPSMRWHDAADGTESDGEAGDIQQPDIDVKKSKSEGVERKTEKRDDDDHDEVKLFVEIPQTVPWYLYIKRPLHGLTPGFVRSSHHDPNGDRLMHSVAYGSKDGGHLRQAADDMAERFRAMLEACDEIQGVQVFVDGDSALGGVAARTLETIRDDHDAKLPIFSFCTFPPAQPVLPITPGDAQSTDGSEDFEELVRDECVLNRYLANHLLGEVSSVYTPLDLGVWGQQPGQRRAGSYFCPAHEDPATAQIVAMLVDSALYGARAAEGSQQYRLRNASDVLRPAPSMRVCSAASAVPLMPPPEPSLWSLMMRNRLCDFSGLSTSSSFVPLSHLFDDATDDTCYSSPARRVLSHIFTLRGAGKLEDVTFPRLDAERRYAAPLATSTYISTIASEGYPISGTFPPSVLLPAASRNSAAWNALQTVDVASHLMCTHSAAPSIGSANAAAAAVLRRRRHVFARSFPLEVDEWRAIAEECDALYDSYNHGEPS
jgi:hypothetical protein